MIRKLRPSNQSEEQFIYFVSISLSRWNGIKDREKAKAPEQFTYKNSDHNKKKKEPTERNALGALLRLGNLSTVVYIILFAQFFLSTLRQSDGNR